MAIDCILAMTAAEIRGNSILPLKIAWLSCHFSPCDTGLSNIPDKLPPGSLLILDDSAPYCGHDPRRITDQLLEAIERLHCSAVLLDFQRPGDGHVSLLAKTLAASLPCPVAVSEFYAGGLDCPVFLPPVPPDQYPSEYLKPWQGREIWLDLAPGGMVITLTRDGASTAPLPVCEIPAGIVHSDPALHCRYTIAVRGDCVVFSLFRTEDDLQSLQEEARSLGVAQFIGLWQELRGGCSTSQTDNSR